MLLPLPQGLLVKYIGSLRTNTAAQTDERVRLTSEAIDGVLAAKMMGGWVGGWRSGGGPLGGPDRTLCRLTDSVSWTYSPLSVTGCPLRGLGCLGWSFGWGGVAYLLVWDPGLVSIASRWGP